jgi:hypothetical protein
MTKALLSFVSFGAGVLSTLLLLSGNHISTLPQSAFAANAEFWAYEIPIVKPLDPRAAIPGGEFKGNEGMLIRLDGLNCKHCVFGDPVYEYGGGDINCPDCRFTHPDVKILPIGAARNTLVLLQFIQQQKAAMAPPPAPPAWLANPKIDIALSPQAAKTISLVLSDTNPKP